MSDERIRTPAELVEAPAPTAPPKGGAARGGGKKEGPKEPKDPEEEKKHPRGRGGLWIKKGAGMEGEEDPKVRQLQNRLAALGYPVGRDGRFGPETDKALKTFQADQKIPTSGEVDEATTAALKSAKPKEGAVPDAPTAGDTAPEPQAPPGAEPDKAAGAYGKKYEDADAVKAQNTAVAGDSDLERSGDQNEKGQDVNSKGELTGKDKPKKPKADRSKSGGGGSRERATGEGGASESGGGGERSALPKAGRETLTKGRGMGDKPDKATKVMQTLLDAIGGNLGEAGADGRFGPDTARALRRFQRQMGLKVDGVFGKETRAALTRRAATTAAKEAVRPGASLEETTSGRQRMQEKLEEAVADRKAASNGRDFSRARAREVRLREQLEESKPPWLKGKGDGDGDNEGAGMKRCPSCKMKNAKGKAKCWKCGGALAKDGDATMKKKGEKVEEATSSASLPDIPNKPGKTNWVEKAGGLPSYIRRIAKHLQAQGKGTGQSIAIAVNAAKKMCASGDTNLPGAQQVNAKSRAEACAAVADWSRKRKAGSLSEALALMEGWDDGILSNGLDLAELAEAAAAIVDEERDLEEAAQRGGNRRAPLKRLPNGHFAPRGQGSVLIAGTKVTLPHKSGAGKVDGEVVSAGGPGKPARVKLTSGPDAGQTVDVADGSAGAASAKKYPGPSGDGGTEGSAIGQTSAQRDARAREMTGDVMGGIAGRRVRSPESEASAARGAAIKADIDRKAKSQKEFMDAKARARQPGGAVQERVRVAKEALAMQQRDAPGDKTSERLLRAELASAEKELGSGKGMTDPSPAQAKKIADGMQPSTRAAMSRGEASMELYRNGSGQEVWRIRDAKGKVVEDDVSSDSDAQFILDGEKRRASGKRDAADGGGSESSPADGTSGRSDSGRLRNFKSMSPAKLKATIEAVRAEGNDGEAGEALDAEQRRRLAGGQGVPAPAPGVSVGAGSTGVPRAASSGRPALRSVPDAPTPRGDVTPGLTGALGDAARAGQRGGGSGRGYDADKHDALAQKAIRLDEELTKTRDMANGTGPRRGGGTPESRRRAQQRLRRVERDRDAAHNALDNYENEHGREAVRPVGGRVARPSGGARPSAGPAGGPQVDQSKLAKLNRDRSMGKISDAQYTRKVDNLRAIAREDAELRATQASGLSPAAERRRAEIDGNGKPARGIIQPGAKLSLKGDGGNYGLPDGDYEVVGPVRALPQGDSFQAKGPDGQTVEVPMKSIADHQLKASVGGDAAPSGGSRSRGGTESGRTGRSPSGRVRNFRSMSDEKLAQTLAAVTREGNDDEAMRALRAEKAKRTSGPGGDADTEAMSRILANEGNRASRVAAGGSGADTTVPGSTSNGTPNGGPIPGTDVRLKDASGRPSKVTVRSVASDGTITDTLGRKWSAADVATDAPAAGPRKKVGSKVRDRNSGETGEVTAVTDTKITARFGSRTQEYPASAESLQLLKGGPAAADGSRQTADGRATVTPARTGSTTTPGGRLPGDPPRGGAAGRPTDQAIDRKISGLTKGQRANVGGLTIASNDSSLARAQGGDYTVSRGRTVLGTATSPSAAAKLVRDTLDGKRTTTRGGAPVPNGDAVGGSGSGGSGGSGGAISRGQKVTVGGKEYTVTGKHTPTRWRLRDADGKQVTMSDAKLRSSGGGSGSGASGASAPAAGSPSRSASAAPGGPKVDALRQAIGELASGHSIEGQEAAERALAAAPDAPDALKAAARQMIGGHSIEGANKARRALAASYGDRAPGTVPEPLKAPTLDAIRTLKGATQGRERLQGALANVERKIKAGEPLNEDESRTLAFATQQTGAPKGAKMATAIVGQDVEDGTIGGDAPATDRPGAQPPTAARARASAGSAPSGGGSAGGDPKGKKVTIGGTEYTVTGKHTPTRWRVRDADGKQRTIADGKLRELLGDDGSAAPASGAAGSRRGGGGQPSSDDEANRLMQRASAPTLRAILRKRDRLETLQRQLRTGRGEGMSPDRVRTQIARIKEELDDLFDDARSGSPAAGSPASAADRAAERRAERRA